MDNLLGQERNATVRALVRALDLHVPGEGDHAERVAVYAVAIGDCLGLDEDQLLHLRWSATLHDVGKVAIDARLLSKLGQLEDAEIEEMRRHAHAAYAVLEMLPWLVNCLPAIRSHHERWDGAGYPDGLRGEGIPLEARIIGVAETFDFLANGTGWRPSGGRVAAKEEIKRCSGSQFDPKVVEAFLAIEPLIQPITA